MAFTQTQLDALQEAYASGVLTIKHGDNLVTYQSMTELEKAIKRIEAHLSPRPRVHYPTFKRE